MEGYKGYILTREQQDNRGRHLLSYTGISDQGPFEIIITRDRPLFFIEHSVELPSHISFHERRSVDLTSFEGTPVDALYFRTQTQLYRVRKQLWDKGIKTFEADIRPEDRFLMERFIHGNIEIKGSCQLRAGLLRFVDPEFYPTDCQARFSVLSLDIETGQKGELYSIACHFEAIKKYDQPQTAPVGIVLIRDNFPQESSPPAPGLPLNIGLPGVNPEPLTDTGWMIRLPGERDLLKAFLEIMNT